MQLCAIVHFFHFGVCFRTAKNREFHFSPQQKREVFSQGLKTSISGRQTYRSYNSYFLFHRKVMRDDYSFNMNCSIWLSILFSLNSFAFSRAACEKRRYISSEARRLFILSSSAARLCGSTRKPFTPSVTSSVGPPSGGTMAGTPYTMASSMVRPKVSIQASGCESWSSKRAPA